MDLVQTDTLFPDSGEIEDQTFDFEAVMFRNGDYYGYFTGYEELHGVHILHHRKREGGRHGAHYVLRELDECVRRIRAY